MSKTITSRLILALLILAVGLLSSATAFANATITIQNNDAGSTGFNDPTPAAPVGGNNGTTIGQQRLNAFNFAAGIWGATINSSQTIVISASWAALSCSPTSGTLGAAGSFSREANFPNAPFPNTWYSNALANALSNSDRNGATPEIDAQFNLSLGTPQCLSTSPWYYGLDGNHGDGVDLVSVLLHEFAHGLGFQTFTNRSTGAFPGGFSSIYDRFLRDNTTGKLWVDMTNAERAASAVNTGNLVWAGPQVVADVPNVLGTPRLRINSPPGIAGNYTVGTAEFGPRVPSTPLTANVVRAFDLADGAGPTTTDGCSAFTNAGAISGNIAFIDRGNCNFTVKVKNAQNAGAVGVIIGNVSGSPNETIPPGMAGSDSTITISSVSLAVGDANSIRAQLGGTVNGSILLDHSVSSGADSSNRPFMYAPNPLESGSSVSHFDVSLSPNQLMEPNNSPDLTHNVVLPFDLTFSLFRDLGWTGPSSTPLPSIQFSASTTSAAESVGSVSITVTRTGDTSGVSTIDYATSDTAGTNACATVTGAASSRCDYSSTLGSLSFAAGETQKTLLVPVIDDSFAEGAETFKMTLSNVSGATLGGANEITITINDNDGATGTNPIDQTNFFVRQNYIDFLNREPDSSGFNFWTNEINSCGANAACIDVKRINVSAAFFVSIEFQQTGYLVERLYKVAYGDAVGTSTLGGTHQLAVPIVRLNEFLSDTQAMGKGVVIGAPGADQLLENNKQAVIADFVLRSRFLTAHPLSNSPGQFVNDLSNNAGPGVISTTERDQLISELTSGSKTRAQVLRAVAEDSDLFAAERNRAFVLAQFIGYLRRNPNDPPEAGLDYTGYDFWLGKLNQFNGNFVNAEMVKAFIISGEYQGRFGP